MPKKLTQIEAIKRAKEIHKDKLSFEKSVYVDMNTRMCVTCPIHGDFWIKPVNLIHQHQGCKYCSHQSYPSTKEMFVEKANLKFNNKYTYEKTSYKNNKTKIWVTCPIHGDFEVRPDNHLHGSGCPKCGKISMASKEKFTKNKFIKLAESIHGNKYDYSKVEYIDYNTKVCIICPIHGEFWQTPDNHLHNHGCPFCKESKLEKKITDCLMKNHIKFIRQKTYNWLKYKKNLYLDFYLPDYNIAIECQGIQHYKISDFFGGEKEFKEIVARDTVKLMLCKNKGIKILFFSDTKGENIINDLNSLLKNIR
jgi:very-short-patch-repair endonuclease